MAIKIRSGVRTVQHDRASAYQPRTIYNFTIPVVNDLMKKCSLFFTLELDVIPHMFGSPVAELIEDRNQ